MMIPYTLCKNIILVNKLCTIKLYNQILHLIDKSKKNTQISVEV